MDGMNPVQFQGKSVFEFSIILLSHNRELYRDKGRQQRPHSALRIPDDFVQYGHRDFRFYFVSARWAGPVREKKDFIMLTRARERRTAMADKIKNKYSFTTYTYKILTFDPESRAEIHRAPEKEKERLNKGKGTGYDIINLT